MSDPYPTLFASDDVVEQVLNDFQSAWKRGEPASLATLFVRMQGEPESVRESVELLLLLQDQTFRWQMWKRQRIATQDTAVVSDGTVSMSQRAPLLEDYLQHCSGVTKLETLPSEMIAHEFRLRLGCGDSPTVNEYLERFPHQQSQLAVILPAAMTAIDSFRTATNRGTQTAIGPGGQPKTQPSESTESTLPVPAEYRPQPRKDHGASSANFGQYEILGEIARGAMGIVYRARHVTIEKIVALKMIKKEGQFASDHQIEQFLSEAKNAGRLEHDNIVRIYDAGQVNGQYYIAMAFIEGQSLSDLVRDKPLSAQRAAEAVETVARALHFGHTQPQPVIHRDIKPANILLDKSGRCYVTDFGIAKRVERDASGNEAKDDVAGTPSYMPPEQTFGRDIGPWSDVYSTGAMLYHLLTGKPPFLADSLMETIRQVRDSEPLPPSELNPKVDPDLEAVCLKCLEKDRTKRYQTAAELADDLRRFLNHEPTRARPISPFGQFAKWCYRKPVIAAMTLVIVVLLGWVAVSAKIESNEQARLRTIAEDNAQKAEDQRKKAEANEKLANENEKLASDNAKKEAIQRKKAEENEKRASDNEKLALDNAKKEEIQRKKAEENAVLAKKNEGLAKASEANAIEQRALAESNLQRAIQTVNVILTRSAESSLKDVPGMEEFRKRVAQDAIEQLEPILKANTNQKEAMEARAKVLVVMGKIASLTGADNAEKNFEAAIGEYKRLAEVGGTQTTHSLDMIAAYRQWGDSLTDRAKVDLSSTTNRVLEKDVGQQLNQALEKYTAALNILKDETNSDSDLFKIELARLQQSRSITLVLLNQPQAAVSSLQEAIDTLKQTSKEQIDSQQRLGNCWRLLASQENLVEPNPSQEKLERWLGHLDRAKEIHQHLFEINGTSAEIRFDLAQTCCSRARVLANLGELDVAGRFEQALRELVTASELLKELAADFRRTPGYELLRISALQLQATIYVDQKKHLDAARKFEEADSAIKAFNENKNYPAARQDNLRLRICLSALELGIDMLSSTDSVTKKANSVWLSRSFRELSQSPEESVKRGTASLVVAAERFSAAFAAEEQKQPTIWLRELKAADVAIREYSKASANSDSVGDYLRLKICKQAFDLAKEFDKKNDQATVGTILEWLQRVLDELKESTNDAVSQNAKGMLAVVGRQRK